MDTQCGQNVLNVNQLTWTCGTVTLQAQPVNPTLLELGLPQVSGNHMTLKHASRTSQQKVLWWPQLLIIMFVGNWKKLQSDSDLLPASPGLAQRIMNAWTSIGSHKAPLPRRGKRLYADPGVVCCSHACGSFHCWGYYPCSSATTWPNVMLRTQLAQWFCETNLTLYAAHSKVCAWQACWHSCSRVMGNGLEPCCNNNE